MNTTTKVEIYKNEKAMKKGIEREQAKGWQVSKTEAVDQGYGCFKTGCLAIIFLPLALLGKKPVSYMVTFQI